MMFSKCTTCNKLVNKKYKYCFKCLEDFNNKNESYFIKKERK